MRRERRRLLKLSELADAKTQEAETAKDDAERQKAALDAQIAAAEAEARAAKMQGVSRRREVGVLTAQRAVLAKKEKGAAGGAAALAELCGIQATQERALALKMAGRLVQSAAPPAVPTAPREAPWRVGWPGTRLLYIPERSYRCGEASLPSTLPSSKPAVGHFRKAASPLETDRRGSSRSLQGPSLEWYGMPPQQPLQAVPPGSGLLCALGRAASKLVRGCPVPSRSGVSDVAHF